jgi:hypothetical protein
MIFFFKKCETGDMDCNARERIVERRTLRGGDGASSHAHAAATARSDTLW